MPGMTRVTFTGPCASRTASMRPRLNAGDDQHKARMAGCILSASMRPRLNAGDDLFMLFKENLNP